MRLLLSVIGLAQGGTVGAAAILVLHALGIPSRSAAVTSTQKNLPAYGWAVAAGIAAMAPLHLGPVENLLGMGEGGRFLLPAVGLLAGLFVGMLLTALVEVLDIFPALQKKAQPPSSLKLCILALALGKTAGTLFFYLTGAFASL